jgi:hypothetical protein
LSSAQSELEAVIKSIKFKKMSAIPLIIPGLFAAVSLALITVSLRELINLLAASTSSPSTEITPEYILWSQVLVWGVILYFAYLIASTIAVYSALGRIREHIYNSALTTYYYTRGVDYVGSLYYLRDMLNRSSLPAPITGLLITLLTGGLAYPVIICFAEKATRTHASIEEEAFFKKASTRPYRASAMVAEIAIALLTLGAYTAYTGYRLTRTLNRHVDTIHSKHPEPPSTPPHVTPEPGSWLATGSVAAIMLAFSAVTAVLAYLGFYYSPQLAFGLLLSALISKRSEKSVLSNIGAGYLLLVVLIVCGFVTGYLGHSLYKNLYGDILSLSKLVSYLDVRGLVLFIFTNNAAISVSSIIPYIGGVFLAQGTYNAGLALGVISALRGIHPAEALEILIYPHAIPELIGYSTLLSASSRFGRWKVFTVIVLIGLIVLLAAAIIETALIVHEGAITFENIISIARSLVE